MNGLGRALIGFVAGTILGFSLAVLLYVLWASLTDYRGDFGLGFGLVIAPAIGIAWGIAGAVWLWRRGRLEHPAAVLFGAVGLAFMAYLLALYV